MTSTSRRSRAGAAAVAALLAAAGAPSAHADEPAPPPATPKSAPKAGVKPPVPVKLTLEAASPDPPWKVRIENTGEHPIRIPADARLLALEVESPTTKGKRTVKCSAPRGLRPAAFPPSRELYLKPGEAYEEAFDPRLFCFGASVDALRAGATVGATFGFSAGAGKAAFAAQGTVSPDDFAPVRELKLEAKVTLPDVAPSDPATSAARAPAARVGPRLEREGAEDGPAPAWSGTGFVDMNVADLDVYVDRFEDAGAPRDVAVTIRAVNEGKRRLATVVRGRMLTFRVEELGPDNRPKNTVLCAGQHAPHAVPRDMVQDLGPKQSVHVPILVAEMCPPGATFQRPGLYRVVTMLDTRIDGEATKSDPYLAQELARQPVLVRLATAPNPYHETPPAPAGAEPQKTNEAPTGAAAPAGGSSAPAHRGSKGRESTRP